MFLCEDMKPIEHVLLHPICVLSHLMSSPSPGFSSRGGQKPEGGTKNQKWGPHF